MLVKYNKCTFCKSKKLKKIKNQKHHKNFYVQSIISDLKISKKKLSKIKIYECQNCKIRQNSPWFTESISRKIYSNIYGQHNRNWENLLNFINKLKAPNHGKLFEKLRSSIKIKNYAEYNSSFMGLFLNFFYFNYKNKSKLFYKELHKNIIKYLTSRQLAGKTKKQKDLSKNISVKFVNKILNLKNKYKKNIKLKKVLFIDNSSLKWGANDNYKSVNSRSYAQEMFDLELQEFEKYKTKTKFDVFGIFHSLDHTFEPSKILNFALKYSKFVVVYCHNQKEDVSIQHQFSLTKKFLNYLIKKKIYVFDITEKISKRYMSPEIYFICSKNKNELQKLKKNF